MSSKPAVFFYDCTYSRYINACLDTVVVIESQPLQRCVSENDKWSPVYVFPEANQQSVQQIHS